MLYETLDNQDEESPRSSRATNKFRVCQVWAQVSVSYKPLELFKLIKRVALAIDIFFVDGVSYSAMETNVGLTGV